jgi:hypothetical protein
MPLRQASSKRSGRTEPRSRASGSVNRAVPTLTKVLAYAHDRSETRKQPVARARLEALWLSRTSALSTQVLQELNVATRKLAAPMGRATARKIVAL